MFLSLRLHRLILTLLTYLLPWVAFESGLSGLVFRVWDTSPDQPSIRALAISACCCCALLFGPS